MVLYSLFYIWSRLHHYWSSVHQQDHRSGCLLKHFIDLLKLDNLRAAKTALLTPKKYDKHHPFFLYEICFPPDIIMLFWKGLQTQSWEGFFWYSQYVPNKAPPGRFQYSFYPNSKLFWYNYLRLPSIYDKAQNLRHKLRTRSQLIVSRRAVYYLTLRCTSSELISKTPTYISIIMQISDTCSSDKQVWERSDLNN